MENNMFDLWFNGWNCVDGVGPVDGVDFQTQMSCLRVNPLIHNDYVDGTLVVYYQDEDLEIYNEELELR